MNPNERIDFRFNDEQVATLKEAITFFTERSLTLLGRFDLWSSNLGRKRRRLRPLQVKDVDKLFDALVADLSPESCKTLTRYDFHTAVLLLDFMSHEICEVAEKYEDFLDRMGAYDDGEYEENEFSRYRRLYERLNRELPDTMFPRSKSKK